MTTTKKKNQKTFPALTIDDLALLKQTCLISEYPGQYGFLKQPTLEQAKYHFSEAKERTVALLDTLAYKDTTKQNTIKLDYVSVDMDVDDDEEENVYEEVLVRYNGITVGVFTEVINEINQELLRGHFMFFPIEAKSLDVISTLIENILENIESKSKWKVII